MAVIREYKDMDINCYNKNIQDMTEMSQPQVSAVLKKLDEKGRYKESMINKLRELRYYPFFND